MARTVSISLKNKKRGGGVGGGGVWLAQGIFSTSKQGLNQLTSRNLRKMCYITKKPDKKNEKIFD